MSRMYTHGWRKLRAEITGLDHGTAAKGTLSPAQDPATAAFSFSGSCRVRAVRCVAESGTGTPPSVLDIEIWQRDPSSGDSMDEVFGKIVDLPASVIPLNNSGSIFEQAVDAVFSPSETTKALQNIYYQVDSGVSGTSGATIYLEVEVEMGS